jgi:thiamine-monophosphate kinase
VCTDGPVRRSGARPGDLVAVCGRLGWAAAGYHVLGRGFRSPRVVVEAHRRPEPPYKAGPEAAKLGATAMIDVSDGLLADLGHVADESGVAVDVRSDAFAIDEPLQSVGSALGADPLAYVLTGGEDYALAATFPPDVQLPAHWRVVGEVRDAGDGPAVTVDGEEYAAARGYEHFR